jgi:hypothetical protein
VLGGDVPTGLSVVQELERKGYIVITSCTTADAASELEHSCKGYVRALVLDPTLVRPLFTAPSAPAAR